MTSTLYLIPSFLSEESIETIPSYILETVKNCSVIFAENERTTRRFLKSLDATIDINQFEWHTIHKVEAAQIQQLKTSIKENKNIAIISEAGCPGIADPGQILVAIAQELNCKIKPLVGPSAILLSLMASGLNGQQFEFVGYLPIENTDRIKKIKELEIASLKNNSTKIFIETPYRNNQLFEIILQHCNGNTKLCIGINITHKEEKIVTKTITEWKKQKIEFHKLPATFLLYAGNGS
jgi:16S rRNA (cytidine1402-2'-O)-methyltransferase